MNTKNQKRKFLRVTNISNPDYFGRSLGIIHIKDAKDIGVESGDFIVVKGDKITVVKVFPSTLVPLGTIGLDPIVRTNAGVRTDEYVEVYKAKVAEAQYVRFAPVENISLLDPERMAEFLKRYVSTYIIPLAPEDQVEIRYFGQRFYFVVIKTEPTNTDAVIVSPRTHVEVIPQPMARGIRQVPKITWEDIGDLEYAKQRIRELVELPLKYPELFRRLGIEPPKGVLLYGPPGTGKTMLAKAVANEVNAAFFAINGPEIMSKWYGESERRLREIFYRAEQNAPSIIFIDEIDAIAPKRSEVTGEVEKRVVSQLLTLMDGLRGRGQVIVIGATNRPEDLDPALRRPGRFDREIEITVPNKRARLEILKVHTRGAPLAPDVSLEKLAEITHGYTGADLAALVREAGMSALRRILPKLDLKRRHLDPKILEELVVTMEDFSNALKEVRPSGLREVAIEIPHVRWSDIGGLENVKKRLQEMVEWPLKYGDLFEYAGLEPPKGILLYGPPGTGKTMLAKAVATESQANFIAVRGPEVLSKWVGESEKRVREIFRKARTYAPCVVFFDEIDAIAPRRGLDIGSRVTERIVSTLLAEMDGIASLRDVVVIAATNRIDIIDPALLRPGRFDRLIEVPMPDLRAREEIFKVHLRKHVNVLAEPLEEVAKALAKETEGFSGADIAGVVREGVLMALREFIAGAGSPERASAVLEEKPRFVTVEHFRRAVRMLRRMKKAVAGPEEEWKKYQIPTEFA